MMSLNIRLSAEDENIETLQLMEHVEDLIVTNRLLMESRDVKGGPWFDSANVDDDVGWRRFNNSIEKTAFGFTDRRTGRAVKANSWVWRLLFSARNLVAHRTQ